MFTRTLDWTLTWNRSVQSTSFINIFVIYILILPSLLRLVLSSGFFPFGFQTKTVCALLVSLVRDTCFWPPHFPWFVDPIKQNKLRSSSLPTVFSAYLVLHSLTAWSSHSWEFNSTYAQLVRKLSAFSRTRRSINVITRVSHLQTYQLWAR
jgi:hypothetical protein